MYSEEDYYMLFDEDTSDQVRLYSLYVHVDVRSTAARQIMSCMYSY